MIKMSDIDSILINNRIAINEDLGQLSIDDRLTYYYVAEKLFTGEGIIVDAGALVGGTSCLFARGLLNNHRISNGNLNEIIHVYDLFEDRYDGPVAKVVRDWFHGHRYYNRAKDSILKKFGNMPKTFNFLPYFEKQTAPFKNMLAVNKCDITTVKLPDNYPIEILSIDVGKTPDLMLETAKIFFPKLIPGKSLVLHQDYIFVFQPWLLIFMEKLEDFFEKVFDTQCCTTIFKLKKPISEQDIINTCGASGAAYYTLDNIQHVYNAAEKCTSRYGKIMLNFSASYMAFHLGQLELARHLFFKTVREFDVSRQMIEDTELIQLVNKYHLDVDWIKATGNR